MTEQKRMQDDFILHMLKGCSQWNEENIIQNMDKLTSACKSNKTIEEKTKTFLENEIKGLQRCLRILRADKASATLTKRGKEGDYETDKGCAR